MACVGLVVAAIGLVVSPNRITGAPAWLKPAKFGVSTTAYTLTLPWLLTLVQGHRFLVRAIAATTAVSLTVELVLIDVQVLRGTTSHFNLATPVNAAIFSTMGALVTAVFIAAVLTGALLLRQRNLPGPMGTAVRAGLGIAIMGMAEAELMLRNTHYNAGGAHTIGAPDGGPGLPVTGWSINHGDLRPAHFIGLHALQVLPLIAWLVARYTTIAATRQRALMRVICGGYAGLVPLLVWQAESDQALLRPGTATLACAAALALATTALATVIIRTRTAISIQP